MKYLIFLLSIIFLIGCSSTKETTSTETKSDSQTVIKVEKVKVPVPEIKTEVTIPYDSTSQSWQAETITPNGDVFKTNITEIPTKAGKPKLKVETNVQPAAVSYMDTTKKTTNNTLIKTNTEINKIPWYQGILNFFEGLLGIIFLVVIGLLVLAFIFRKSIFKLIAL